MNWIRRSLWIVALLPTAAAVAYLALAASYPEPVATRQQGGWSPSAWHLSHWLGGGNGPYLPGQRGLVLGLLEVPGATLAAAALACVVLGVLIAILLARSATRASSGSFPLAFAAVSLWCLSPGFGANWLYVERVGVFVPPLLLLLALAVLSGQGGSVWRLSLAALLAALAPTVHPLGAVVALALWPAAADCATRDGRRGWLGAGGVAAVGLAVAFAGWIVGGWHGSPQALMLGLVDELPRTSLELLMRLGAVAGDLLPGTRYDEAALGMLFVVLLLAMPWLPARGEENCARWWSLAICGALVVLLAEAWLPRDAEVANRVAFTYGAFCLPLGLVGIAATRFSPGLWPVALGLSLVLGLQEWQRGVEVLTDAHLQSVRVAASLSLPSGVLEAEAAELRPFASVLAYEALTQRSAVPATRPDLERIVLAVAEGTQVAPIGAVLGGSPIEVHGIADCAVRDAAVGAVFAVAGSGGQTALLGGALTKRAGGRSLAWRVAWGSALPEGTRVAVVAYLPGTGQVQLLGVRWVRGGTLVESSSG